jgi:SAM-dependent methyltransferase
MQAYRHPDYYEIALAPRDPAAELDFFEATIGKFSKAKVRRVFELGAGTAPLIEEWHRRGYAYCGLDLSPAMLDFAREKASRKGIEASLVLGDRRALDPGLDRFDLAYVMLGSLYMTSNREFLYHLARMVDLLAHGALYCWTALYGFAFSTTTAEAGRGAEAASGCIPAISPRSSTRSRRPITKP